MALGRRLSPSHNNRSLIPLERGIALEQQIWSGEYEQIDKSLAVFCEVYRRLL